LSEGKRISTSILPFSENTSGFADKKNTSAWAIFWGGSWQGGLGMTALPSLCVLCASARNFFAKFLIGSFQKFCLTGVPVRVSMLPVAQNKVHEAISFPFARAKTQIIDENPYFFQ